MPQTWQAREVAIVLPIAVARAVWDGAGRFDLEASGRFDRRGAAVLVWSAPFDAAGDRAEPVGAFCVRWRDPHEGARHDLAAGVGPNGGRF